MKNKEITTELLTSYDACKEGMKWVTKSNLIGLPAIDFITKLMESEKNEWANWLIVRIFDYRDKIRYAIFSAEQVISIYEAKNPNDDRPRKAIEAAQEYLNNPTKKNKNAAAYAADAAYAAARAAARAAAYAADAAARKTMQITILNYGISLLNTPEL